MTSRQIKKIARIISFFGAVCVGEYIPASQAADAGRGQQLAAAWCETCHTPLTQRKPGSLSAPPLTAIAEKQPLDNKVLEQRLLSSHPQMPERALSREEAADISAYILSLRR